MEITWNKPKRFPRKDAENLQELYHFSWSVVTFYYVI